MRLRPGPRPVLHAVLGVLPRWLQAPGPPAHERPVTISWLTVGAFLAGMILMSWIKSFQVKSLMEDLEEVVLQRDKALAGQARITAATEEVIHAERVVDRARDLPRPDGLKLLLDDSRPDGSGRSGGAA